MFLDVYASWQQLAGVLSNEQPIFDDLFVAKLRRNKWQVGPGATQRCLLWRGRGGLRRDHIFSIPLRLAGVSGKFNVT